MDKRNVGGQALIEGVMMQCNDKIVMAVREPSGKIVSKSKPFKSRTKRYPWKLPIVRGSIALVEMLAIGIKALNWSASINIGEEEKINTWQIVMTMVFAFGFALLLFKFLPLGFAQLLTHFDLFNNRYLFNLIEGLSKVFMVALYIYVIGFMKDVKRVFMYHGAEHKAVNCYEAGKELTVKNASKFSTVHKRCGSSFILLVLFISILVYILLPMEVSFWVKYGLRILLLPLIAGLAYEVLKLNAKRDNLLLKAFVRPGLWLQKLTTKEPNEKQLEVALFALKKCLK
ncbi:MAG: DUF1385 domain-containing protein [Nanoarchaeota archaeon]|nr:DUF1385 domain-containing protein [Nanoarchaeota archaeon]